MLTAGNCFGGVQAGEELADGLGLAGEEQIGGDFDQGREDKPTLMGPGMRKHQPWAGTDFIAKGDQIEVEGARFVQNLFCFATEFTFEVLQFA